MRDGKLGEVRKIWFREVSRGEVRGEKLGEFRWAGEVKESGKKFRERR